MGENTKKYRPAGQCIYCGSDGGENGLGREHIIPKSIGGDMVLGKASCRKCEGETSYIEGWCARNTFLPTRIQHKIPRKDKSAEAVYSTFSSIGSEPTGKLPMEEGPSFLTMPRYCLPGILVGIEPSKVWPRASAYVRGSFTEHPDSYGPDSLKIPSVSHGLFARFVAKISHSYVSANLGVGNFSPMLIDTILNADPFMPYLVGGDIEIPPETEHVGHSIEWRIVDVPTHEKQLIVVTLRLFSHLGTPNYHAVVGTPAD